MKMTWRPVTQDPGTQRAFGCNKRPRTQQPRKIFYWVSGYPGIWELAKPFRDTGYLGALITL